MTKQYSGIIVFASNQKRFLDQAIALAVSVLKNSPRTPVALGTNLNLPGWAESLFTSVKQTDFSTMPGVSYKFHIDNLMYFESGNLMLDSDYLVYGDLSDFLESLIDVAVTSFRYGDDIHRHWFVSDDDFTTAHKQGKIPALSGDAHYLRPSQTTYHVFNRIRSLAERYDELGFQRWRGGVNDEPVFAMAYRDEGIELVERDPFILCNAVRGRCKSFRSNCLQGKASAVLSDGRKGDVLALHFEQFANRWVYWREQGKLIAWYRFEKRPILRLGYLAVHYLRYSAFRMQRGWKMVKLRWRERKVTGIL